MELKLIPGSGNAYRADVKSVWAESIGALRVVDADYDLDTNRYMLWTTMENVLELLDQQR